ncbi:hypothetical protein [Dokdonella sp.]|uniref:hypothetical protein n=1 Tax=Dokdonella sp. TaxID=2291710 RepID=UPI002F426090
MYKRSIRSIRVAAIAACITLALPVLALAQATEETGTLADIVDVQSTHAPAAIWLPPADVLFSNGAFADGTEATCSGDAGNASILESATLNTTLGFNVSLTATTNFRIADQFTVPAGPGWNVTNAHVMAYQTGSTTTSTMTAVNFRLWNGSPADAGSSVLCGDGATNAMSATEFSGVFRMVDTGPGCTRPVMVQTVSLAGCPALAPGTYWLDYQIAGTLTSGPWTPPVVTLGSAGSGDAVQFDGNAWNPLIDNGSGTQQDVPFFISGTSASALEVDTAGAVVTDQCATAPAQDNGVVEPGEHVLISVPVSAVGGDFTGVNASLGLPAPAGVTYVTSSAVLGDISAGNSATANFEIAVDGGFACLGTFTLPIAISATEGDAAGSLDVDVGSAGNCAVCVDAADLIFRDGFESTAP